MKKLLLAVLALIMFCTANAQSVVSGDLKKLDGINRMALEIDYSDAKIWGLSESDFLDWHLAGKTEAGVAKWKEYWNGKVKDAFVRTYISEFLDAQREDRRIFLTARTSEEEAGHMMIVHVTSIDEHDNVFADISILAPDGSECVTVRCKGRAPSSGSFEHRVRVAFAKLGKNMGKFLS